MPDQPTAVERAGAFAAILQALAATVLREPPRAVEPARRGDVIQNRWAALRFGPQARLVHADAGRSTDVSELADELLERIAPAARELGSSELVAELATDGCEGDRQLEVGRSQGLRAACADIVDRTLGSS